MPRPGTTLRAVYDLLTAQLGQPVELDRFYSSAALRKQAVAQLVETYGLDVRRTRRGWRPRGINPQWTLVGHGPAY